MMRLVLAGLLLLLPAPLLAQSLGIVGDSVSDEYRANDNRGGNYAATTLNWVELLQRKGVDAGAWGTRSEPRRTGYEFNWARSSAVSSAVPAQASGLAALVGQGRVRFVVQMIGANDFNLWNNTYQDCYYGRSTCGAAKVSAILSAQSQAMDTILAASPQGFVVVTVPDIGQTPRVLSAYTSATNRARVTAVINAVNDGIRSAAASRGVAVLDINAVNVALLSRMTAGNLIDVGGEFINPATAGDEPHNLTLGDAQHGGTVLGGFLANEIVQVLNLQGFGVTPFTDAEMLVSAGITTTPPPTGAPTAPTNLQIVSGTKVGGALSSLVADDNVTWQLRSPTSGTIRESISQITWDGVTYAAGLKAAFKLRSNTNGTSLQIEALNAATGVWEAVLVSPSGLGSSETAWVANLSSAHVSGGRVAMRIRTWRSGTNTTQYADYAALVGA